MKSRLLSVCALALLLTTAGASMAAATPATKPLVASLSFNGTEFLFRWSQADQFEFTPAGQKNLEHWDDMLTLNYFRTATTGESLAGVANAIIANYKKHGAIIVRTRSVPRTPEKEAEHFMTVVFPQPAFIEAVFVRLKLWHGTGGAVIYSHRIYGQKTGPQASTWLSANGPTLEKAIMNWEAMPQFPVQSK